MQDVAQGSVCDSDKEAQSSQNSDCNSIFGSDTSSTGPNKRHQSFAKLDDKCCASSAESESEEDISEVSHSN